MAIMGNKWIEKEASKNSILKTTAPSYDPYTRSSYDVPDLTKPIKRYSKALKAILVKTLRGTRK